jgi:hypothetical protein
VKCKSLKIVKSPASFPQHPVKCTLGKKSVRDAPARCLHCTTHFVRMHWAGSGRAQRKATCSASASGCDDEAVCAPASSVSHVVTPVQHNKRTVRSLLLRLIAAQLQPLYGAIYTQRATPNDDGLSSPDAQWPRMQPAWHEWYAGCLYK